MEHEIKSIRPFIGAKDFNISRSFYKDLGFIETVLSRNMSVFKRNDFAFYLQDAYVKDWIANTMVFLEVTDVNTFFEQLQILNLSNKYPEVRIVPINEHDWGKECFIHDPSGILWHVGEFTI